jgi:hypothetical protein
MPERVDADPVPLEAEGRKGERLPVVEVVIRELGGPPTDAQVAAWNRFWASWTMKMLADGDD